MKYLIFLQPPEIMATIKLLHVLFVFIWVGNLLSLTRLLGYHIKEDEHTQMRMALVYRRMYNFVGLPSMVLALTFGAILISKVDPDQGLLWFVYKLAFAVGMVACDLICGHYISELVEKPAHGKGVKFKVLHGVCGLLLIGVLICVYVLRP